MANINFMAPSFILSGLIFSVIGFNFIKLSLFYGVGCTSQRPKSQNGFYFGFWLSDV